MQSLDERFRIFDRTEDGLFQDGGRLIEQYREGYGMNGRHIIPLPEPPAALQSNRG